MSWAYEGVQCYVSAVPRDNYVPVYRAWNGGDHFYTASKPEYDGLPPQYSREGVGFYVAARDLGNYQPLFRLYRGAGDDHFYTTSVLERDNAVVNLGYSDEGVLGYVLSGPTPGHTELFRAYNPEIVDHFYTTAVAEIDNNGPTLNRGDLEGTLKNQMKSCLANAKMYFADASYFCPTVPVSQGIVTASKVDQQRYIAEIHDCDDFAHLLKAAFIMDAYDGGRRTMPYALGIAWGTQPGHAMNVLVTGDGASYTVRLVEPQTGNIHELSENKLKGIYLVVF